MSKPYSDAQPTLYLRVNFLRSFCTPLELHNLQEIDLDSPEGRKLIEDQPDWFTTEKPEPISEEEEKELYANRLEAIARNQRKARAWIKKGLKKSRQRWNSN